MLTGSIAPLVCKTCSDYNHTCLGYSDPPSHVRSQSDSTSRRPTLSSLPSAEATNPDNTRAVESQSPDPPSRYNGLSKKRRASEISKSTRDFKNAFSSKESSSRTAKDSEQQQHTAGDSPGSSKLTDWPTSSASLAMILCDCSPCLLLRLQVAAP